jgi:AcrR family transcriptional regulator
MTKQRAQAAPAMMLRVEQAFMDHGYSGLSMIGLAKACDLTARTLYNYFSNKEEAFRGICRFRNELNIQRGFLAGRTMLTQGGSALDVFAEIINIRYGDTRRIANASPHLIELNAEIFKRCNDIVTEVALSFEADLAHVVVDLQEAGLLKCRPDVTPERLAKALANGARGVNQRLPPCPPENLAENYREICQFVLLGGAEWLAPAESSNKEKDSVLPLR